MKKKKIIILITSIVLILAYLISTSKQKIKRPEEAIIDTRTIEETHESEITIEELPSDIQELK